MPLLLGRKGRATGIHATGLHATGVHAVFTSPCSGDIGRLLSPVFEATPQKIDSESKIERDNKIDSDSNTDSCILIFYYHMNGDHVENLQVDDPVQLWIYVV